MHNQSPPWANTNSNALLEAKRLLATMADLLEAHAACYDLMHSCSPSRKHFKRNCFLQPSRTWLQPQAQRQVVLLCSCNYFSKHCICVTRKRQKQFSCSHASPGLSPRRSAR